MALVLGIDGNYWWGPDEDAADGTEQINKSAAGGKTLNLNSGTPYQRPTGIPAYNGYQPPNYAATTPNSTHWLNTMNAYAPTARTDMERLLGQGGGSAGGGMKRTPSPMTGRPGTGWQTGNTQGEYTPTPLSLSQQQQSFYNAPSTGLLGGPVQPATQPAPATQPTNPFPTEWTQNSAPGYMDAFWNVPGSAYAPPGTQAQQPPATQPAATQPKPEFQFQGQTPGYMDAFWNTAGSAYSPPGTQTQQQTASSQPVYQQANNWSNGTVGINPSTGALMFLGNTE